MLSVSITIGAILIVIWAIRADLRERREERAGQERAGQERAGQERAGEERAGDGAHADG